MENKSTAFFDQQQFNKIKEYRFAPNELLKFHIKEFLVVECDDVVLIDTLPSTPVSLNYIIKGTIKMRSKDDFYIQLPPAFAFGIARNSLNFEFSKCTTLLVIIFQPGLASALINTPINEFFENFTPYDEFFNSARVSFIKKQLQNQDNYHGVIKAVEDFLMVEAQWSHTDGIIKDAIVEIIENEGVVSMPALLDKFSISRDSFEKKFRKLVGTSPKKFSNIVRFRSLFEKNETKTTLTELGLNAGYYDQSHFIKDFKTVTGKKPSDFF